MMKLCALAAGQHGFNGYVPGTVLLSAGLHGIEIDYFQVSWKWSNDTVHGSSSAALNGCSLS